MFIENVRGKNTKTTGKSTETTVIALPRLLAIVVDVVQLVLCHLQRALFFAAADIAAHMYVENVRLQRQSSPCIQPAAHCTLDDCVLMLMPMDWINSSL